MVKIVTSKAWNNKAVRVLGIMVEAYETYKHEIFYNVCISLFPTDASIENHPVMKVVERIEDLRQALDIRNALREIDDEYSRIDDIEVILTVKLTNNGFQIEKELKEINPKAI